MIPFNKLYMNESKESTINSMPLLSPEEKKILIDFFDSHSTLENKIDWNKSNKLTFDDFKYIMMPYRNDKKKETFKQRGISSLIEEHDYITLDLGKEDYEAYIPLHWESSTFIASRYLGHCEGKWCVAFKKTEAYWNEYVLQKKRILVYIIGDHYKYAIEVYPDNKTYKIWSPHNEEIDSIPYINIRHDILKYASTFDHIRNNMPKQYTFLDDAIIGHDAKYDIDDHGKVTWIDGLWRNGLFKNGEWEKGIWENGEFRGEVWKSGLWRNGVFKQGKWLSGTWEDGLFDDLGIWNDGVWKKGRFEGIWKGGIWKGGIFKGIQWERGVWIDGTFNDGTWIDGDWMNGVWEYGIWKGGVWHGGTWKDGMWLGGRDKNGNFHPKGDSPDKWKI